MRTLVPYWTTRGLASDLFEEMDRLFDDFNRVAPAQRTYDETTLNPACDISETDEHFLLSVDLPGMKKEDIKIEVNENILTISGERKREATSDKSERVQRYEKSFGFFKRSFTLPTSIDADKVEAHYEDGVLGVYLPKTQVAKPRHIEIQSGKGGIFSKLLGAKKSAQDLKNTN